MSRTLIFLFLFIPFLTLAQTKYVLKGVVSDENNVHLSHASIIARSLGTDTQPVQFSKTDQDGAFALNFNQQGTIEIVFSRIGYTKVTDTIKIDRTLQEIKVNLIKSSTRLSEVKIDYKYQAVQIGKDTIRFMADYFRDGSERKLQDLLEKMPGFSMEDGRVKFQGKIVNITLLENERFFGGGSKIAVENIPADAVDNVEMISRFSENEMMKAVQVNDQLAMNIKLKANKKNFVFGDLETAVGNHESYKEHAALFYYSPNKTGSFIADVNSIGLGSLTKEDITRVQSSELQYFNNTSSNQVLYDYAKSNQRVQSNINKLATIHGTTKVLDKRLKVTLYALYSENRVQSLQDIHNNYTFPDSNFFEKRQNRNNQKNGVALANIALKYKRNPYFNVDYTVDFDLTNPRLMQVSTMEVDHIRFSNSQKNESARAYSVKQFLEGNWKHSVRRYSTFALQHQFSNNKAQFKLSSDKAFFENTLNFLDENRPGIFRPIKRVENLFNVSLKHYLVLDHRHQLHFELNSQNQILRQEGTTMGVLDSINPNIFNHDQHYRTGNTFLGLYHRFTWRKLNTLISFKEHFLTFDNKNSDSKYENNRLSFQPEIDINYEIGPSNTVSLKYKQDYLYPKYNEMNPSYWINDYNVIFRGTDSLSGQMQHRIRLYYRNFDIARLRMLYFSSTVQLKNKIKANILPFSTVDQLKGVTLLDRPDFQMMHMIGYSIRIGRFEPEVSSSFLNMKLAQIISNETFDIRQNTFSTSASLRWKKPRYPDIKASWSHTISWQYHIANRRTFTTDKLDLSAKYIVATSFNIRTDWSFEKAIFDKNQSNPISILANLELEYKKGKSPFSFYTQGFNILGNDRYRVLQLTEYIATEQITYVMPRVFMLGLRYKI